MSTKATTEAPPRPVAERVGAALAPEAVRQRVAFDLAPEAVRQLEEIRGMAHASTRAEVVRNALRLYRWFLEQRAEGSEVILRDEKNEKETVIRLVF